MSFLAPLALLVGLLVIPIILLYMLRLRRREMTISSNFLWRQVVEDTEANTPWQRLRRNLLLFLQLLILILLVLALMRPFVTVPTISTGKTVALVDVSTSMNASNPDGSARFDQVRDELVTLVDTMSPLDELMIIQVGDPTQQVTPFLNDPTELRQVITTLQPSIGQADWDTALTLAIAGAAGADDFSVVVLSDGDHGHLQTALDKIPNLPSLVHVPIGTDTNNLGLTALATRALPGQSPSVFTQVSNYGNISADFSLVIKVDGVLTESISSEVSAASQRSFTFSLEQDFETIEAEILLDEEFNDGLEPDNYAWTVADVQRGQRILVVTSDDNLFVNQVLRSIPQIQVFRGDPNRSTLPEQVYDLYVFDNWLPITLPDADMLIIDPPRDTNIFTLGAERLDTDNPQITLGNDPRTRFVDVDDVRIRRFRELENISWAESLISVSGGTIVYAGEQARRQITILPFDLRESDLPLQIAFPVLIANLMNWYSPLDVVQSPRNQTVNQTIQIQPSAQTDTIRIVLPSDDPLEIENVGQVIPFVNTSQPGIYRVVELEDETTLTDTAIAVNAFSLDESNLEPQTIVTDTANDSLDDETTPAQVGIRELAWGLMLAALLVLCIEWYAYHRRLQIPTLRTVARGRR